MAQPNEMKTDIGITRGRDRHLWPIFLRETTADYKKIEAAASLYAYYRYFSDSSVHTHFLPFYSYDSSLNGKKINVGTTFYPSLYVFENSFQHQIKSFRAIELLPYVNMVEFTKSKNGDFLKNNLLFFQWYKNDKITQSSYFVLFPLYWNYKNKYHNYQTLLPLYYAGKNIENNSVRFVSPLFYYAKYPSSLTKVSFPVYWQFKRDSLASTVVFPLYYNRQINATKVAVNVKAFTPFIWLNQQQNETTNSRSLFVLPLYSKRDNYYLNTKLKAVQPELNKESKVAFIPFYWKNTIQQLAYENAKSDYELKKPFQSLSKNEKQLIDTKTNVFVFPSLTIKKASKEGNINRNIAFWPLVFYKHETVNGYQLGNNKAMLPFSRKTNSLSILPFWWQNSLTQQVNQQTVKYHYNWWFVPFIAYGNRFDSSFLSTPNSRKYIALTPLYWYKNNSNSYSRYIKADSAYDLNYHFKEYNHVLFPVFFYKNSTKTNQTKKDSSILSESKSYLLPVYWNSKYSINHQKFGSTIQRKHVGLLPFAAYGYDLERSKKYYSLGLLYWHIAQTKGRNYRFNAFFPLYFGRTKFNNNGRILVSSHWLLPVWRSRVDSLLVPLNGEMQYLINKRKIVFPLHYSASFTKAIGNKKDVVYSLHATTPLIWRYKKAQKTFTTVAPFWWSYKVDLPENKINLKFLLPLVYYQNLHQKWPPNKNFSDTFERIHNYLAILPFYAKNLRYSNYNNQLQKAIGYKYEKMITPLFWQIKDSSGAFTGLMPVYFNYFVNDSLGSKNSTQLLPLYFAKSQHQYNIVLNQHSYKNYKVLLPFYIQKNRKTLVDQHIKLAHSTRLLLPIYYNFNKQQDSFISNVYGITPLIWYTKANGYKNFMALPILYYSKIQQPDNTSNKFAIWPVYARSKSVKLGEHFSMASVQKTHTFFPLFWYNTDSTWDKNKLTHVNNYHVLLPLYAKSYNYYQQNNYEIANYLGMYSPLFWKGTNYTKNLQVDSLGRTEKTKEDYKYAFPFYYAQTKLNETGTESNLYKQTTFFPLFWHKTNEKSSAGSQIFKGKQTTLFPLYYHKYQKDAERLTGTMALTPLFWQLKSKNAQTNLLLPVYVGTKNEHYQSTTLLPLLSFGKSTDTGNNSHLALTPLFWHVKHKQQATTLLLPLFISKHKSETHTHTLNIGLWLYNHVKSDTSYNMSLLWPLVGYSKNSLHKEFHITPLVWYKKTEQISYTAVLPFYYGLKRNDYQTRYFLGPVYIQTKVRDMYKKHLFLGGMYKHVNYANGDYERRFLHLFYANVKQNQDHLKAMFPIYYVKHFANGNYTKSYGLTFYTSIKRKIPDSNEYYKEVKLFWFLRYKSNYAYLLGKGVSVDRKKLK